MRKLSTAILLFAAHLAFADATKLDVSINPEKTFQTIDNFTASDAWSGNFAGQYFCRSAKRTNRKVAVFPKARRRRESRRNRTVDVENKYWRGHPGTGRSRYSAIPAPGGIVPHQGRQTLRLGKMLRAAIFYAQSKRIRLRQISAVFKHPARSVD